VSPETGARAHRMRFRITVATRFLNDCHEDFTRRFFAPM
jgi:hypothetical protein